MQLDSDFEDQPQEAVLDEVESTVREEIGPQLVQTARDNWESYASRHDYDIDFIWEDAELSVTRDTDSVNLTVEWPELSALFEHGVSPHTIEGDPALHFYYERIDQEITVQSVNWGSETGGIPESRAVRDALNQLRGDLQ